jgi:type IV fimbrial biogenesis protein FimT
VQRSRPPAPMARYRSRKTHSGKSSLYTAHCVRTPLRGFSLIELVTTLAVVGVVLLLAAPAFSRLLGDTRVDAAAETLVSHMAYARTLAVNRGVRVSLCSSSDGRTCSGTPDWRSGWLVFFGSPAGDGSIPASDLIRVQNGAGEGIHLRASRACFSYLPDGTIDVRGAPHS